MIYVCAHISQIYINCNMLGIQLVGKKKEKKKKAYSFQEQPDYMLNYTNHVFSVVSVVISVRPALDDV